MQRRPNPAGGVIISAGVFPSAVDTAETVASVAPLSPRSIEVTDPPVRPAILARVDADQPRSARIRAMFAANVAFAGSLTFRSIIAPLLVGYLR